MYTDLYGDRRYKLGLHVHTTISDGKVTPEKAAKIYLDAGFDAIAITDHWIFHAEDRISGLKIISGAEYNLGDHDTAVDVMHILGLGMKTDPKLVRWKPTRQETIDAIRENGGIAILAHPFWSVNTPQDALELHGIAATEIYNTVSDVHESFRPYSGYFVDLVANAGLYLPLLATDDAHYYDGDATRSFVMVKSPDDSTESLLKAIEAGDFYASQGPELLVRREGDRIIADCSPADIITFVTNSAWCPGRVFRTPGQTHAEHTIAPEESWVRVEVKSGNDFAWSNIIAL